MNEKMDFRFKKTLNAVNFFKVLFFIISIICLIYLIVTIINPSDIFQIEKTNFGPYRLSFDKSYGLGINVGLKSLNKVVFNSSLIKNVYIIVILRTLSNAGLLFFILYYLSKIIKNSLVERTPFIVDNIEYLKKLKYLIVIIIVFPNFHKAFLDYTLTGGFALYEDFSILIPIFIAVVTNIIISVFEYGLVIQREFDSLI